MNEKDERRKNIIPFPGQSACEKTYGATGYVNREQAKEIVEQHLKKTARNGFYVERVVAPYELSVRLPSVYIVEIDDNCWIAYLRSEDADWLCSLRSSEIVIVSRRNGKVLYSGSANDEG